MRDRVKVRVKNCILRLLENHKLIFRPRRHYITSQIVSESADNNMCFISAIVHLKHKNSKIFDMTINVVGIAHRKICESETFLSDVPYILIDCNC